MNGINSLQNRRAQILLFFCLGLSAILVLRFFQLQVLSRRYYRNRSEMNSVRQMTVTPRRGLILDRHGRVLVRNRPSYSLFVVPYEFNKNRMDAEIAASRFGMTLAEIDLIVDEKGQSPMRPVRIIRDMDFATLTAVEENLGDMPGVYYQIEPVRTYPSDARASHVLGYTGEAGPADLEADPHRSIQNGDIVGKNGIEKEADAILGGERGYRYVEVDVRGREVGDFGGLRDVKPRPGRDVTLSLDAALQHEVEAVLGQTRGAVVVIEPATGDVLAMASAPDYDLNLFSVGIQSGAWKQLMDDAQKPLLNRAVQAQLPPGSTYKIVTAAAALKKGEFDPEETVNCQGAFVLGRRAFHCWKLEGHGPVNLLKAISGSCNVYFYQLGLKTGLDAWAESGRDFFFGRKTGIDLPGETTGLLPDRAWLDRKFGEKRWSRGLVLNLSVGQGDLLVTPLQMAQMASLAAMKGRAKAPRLVIRWKEKQGEWHDASTTDRTITGLSPSDWQWIRQGMHDVVQAPDGTGRAARLFDVAVCGKTGTAQNPHGDSHAWFIGFAPMDRPKIALVVVIENGGSGGRVAAPLAGMILRWFFQQKGAA